MGIEPTTYGLDLSSLCRLSYKVAQRKSGTILDGESHYNLHFNSLFHYFFSRGVQQSLSLETWMRIGGVIEGLRAKRAYVGFWPIFIFLQDRANFSQTDLFWHETHRSEIVFVDLRFILQK